MNILKAAGRGSFARWAWPIFRPTKWDYDEVLFIDKSMRYYKKCIIKDDRLVGAILMGDKSEFAEFKELIENRIELSRAAVTAVAVQARRRHRVLGKLVCSCNQVGAGNLQELIKTGL